MRQFIITLCVMLAALTVNAQEHLSFKGIPIEGSISTFCQKLKAKGLTQIHSEDNIRLFTGDFTGRDATIGVIADQSGKNVFSVVVLLPKNDEWYSLVNTYDYYKDLYIEKYGKPSFSKENNPSLSDSNFSLMHELYEGKVVYGCVFDVSGGNIELTIDKADGYLQGQVIIRYKDALNIQGKRQADLDEI